MVEKLIEEGNFFHFFQPICNIQSSVLFGFEGLLRSVKEFSPEEWFLLSKKIDKLYELDTWSINNASATFQKAGYAKKNIKLFLNIFPSTLSNPNSLSLIKNIVERNHFKNGQLVLEIVEHEPIEYSHIKETIDVLRRMGVQIAIDDFGQGFTSLKGLIELKPDYIKIDRYFVEGITNSKAKLSIIEGMIHFSKQNNTLIIAEGIKDVSTLDFLKQLGIVYGQGELLGSPSDLFNQRL